MILTLTYLLAVIGLVAIVVTSTLFKPLREGISRQKRDRSSKALKKAFWFLESITNCRLCCSVWAGLILYPVYNCQINVILLPLAGSGFVYILTQLSKKP